MGVPFTASSGSLSGTAGDDALSSLVKLGFQGPVAQKAIETAMGKNPAASEDFETLFRAAMAAIR
jgi:Holliday junction DNA helicase RuvA